MSITTYGKTELDTTTLGFGASAMVTLVCNAALTVAKESYPPLLAFMKSISILGVKHHWLVHGLAVIILFFVLGFAFSRTSLFERVSDRVFAKALAGVTILSSLSIVVFFLLELFK